MRALVLGALGLVAVGAAGEGPNVVHGLGEDLGGHRSAYTDVLRDAVLGWPAPTVPEPSAPVSLACISTPGDAKYVGVLQTSRINASLAAVAAVLDDIPHYKDLFPDCVDVRVVSRDGNRFVTAWEQRAPVFFIPNTTYELTTLVARPSSGRVVYRYQLRRSGALAASDGFVVLDALGPEATLFTEVDFFNARWGLLPQGLVWRESLRGVFLSDVAVKLRAEQPAWSHERIAAEARRILVNSPEVIERCIGRRESYEVRFPVGGR